MTRGSVGREGRRKCRKCLMIMTSKSSETTLSITKIAVQKACIHGNFVPELIQIKE